MTFGVGEVLYKLEFECQIAVLVVLDKLVNGNWVFNLLELLDSLEEDCGGLFTPVDVCNHSNLILTVSVGC